MDSKAREVDVGPYLPLFSSNPSFVLFSATPNHTPALRADFSASLSGAGFGSVLLLLYSDRCGPANLLDFDMASSECCANPPVPSSSSGGDGVVLSIGSLKAYVAGSPDSKAAVLLVSDVFGYEAPNLRKLADKTAAAGFYVVVPDFFHEDPYDPDVIPIRTWLESHGTDKGFVEAKPVVEAVKSKGFTAIGAAGFCWGAKVVAELAKTGEIKAGVMLHPSLVTIDDIKAIKAHLAILGAEIDQTSPPELVKQFEEILSVNSEVESFVKIFPGVAHGWTVRYDVKDEAAVRKAEEAHTDMIGWFVKHLK